MNLTKILAIILFVVSLGLAYYLYDNINSTIEFKEYITTTESQIIDKLAIIRESEKAFLEQHGRYTSNWDSLINFIENGKVPMTVRTETITQLSYGQEKVDVRIDTVGYMDAKDRIFKKNLAINSSTEGVFVEFLVKEGSYVVKGTNAYRMKVNGKTEVYRFTEEGTVASLGDLKPGDEVSKGTNIINLWQYHLNPKVDIKTLATVPGSDKQFEIFVGKVDRGGSKVSVIEVKDPAPINPERRAGNEAKTRQPLSFGSRIDVTTSGNWE
jgi:hypothetical protein